jgi:hypothetical protein
LRRDGLVDRPASVDRKPIRSAGENLELDQSCATDWGLPNPSARIDFGWDKLNHRLAFAALAFSATSA